MPETDTSTRQRLLDLWEKCPACRPDSDVMWSPMYRCWSMDGRSLKYGITLVEDLAFALARDAMMRWLGEAKAHPQIDVGEHGQLGVRIVASRYGCKSFFLLTLIDALISAVEAVMENK